MHFDLAGKTFDTVTLFLAGRIDYGSVVEPLLSHTELALTRLSPLNLRVKQRWVNRLEDGMDREEDCGGVCVCVCRRQGRGGEGQSKAGMAFWEIGRAHV